jgi:hypothetical protein
MPPGHLTPLPKRERHERETKRENEASLRQHIGSFLTCHFAFFTGAVSRFSPPVVVVCRPPSGGRKANRREREGPLYLLTYHYHERYP